MCRSTNRLKVAEPEVWFRIVHVALDSHNGAPVANFREQTVEIALGPKGAFENGNVGTLTRRVSPDRVVNAAAKTRPPAKPPRPPRTPHVVELLRKAQEWRRRIETGEIGSQAEIARREGITRARVTQVMGLLRLAPEIQQHILCLPAMVRRHAMTERALRPIAHIGDQSKQIEVFQTLVG